MTHSLIDSLTKELKLTRKQVEGTLHLLDEGNTIPFITRYRKEATGGLDEQKIQEVQDKAEYFRNLSEKKEEVLKKIQDQGKCTEEIARQIEKATALKTLEDIYLPFRPKKRTRATIAREKGLEPLAEKMLSQGGENPQKLAQAYIDPEKKLLDADNVLQGAMDIVAEIINEDVRIRERVRQFTFSYAQIISLKIKDGEDQAGVYQDYYDYSENVNKIPPHRVLALDRGEAAGVLRVKISISEEEILPLMERIYLKGSGAWTEYLKNAIKDGYKRLLSPAITRELRKEITEKAHLHAIHVFAENLRNLLLISPLKDMRIFAIDPGFASGCKIAALSETGELLEHGVIYPHPPQKKTDKAEKIVEEVCQKHNLNAIAIGNGTACRETEVFISDWIEKKKQSLVYSIVNEAGASVYSASAAARDEFPELDASFRGTVSIGRRLLDPLAELVKIDPKSLGVGLYQHDVNKKELEKALQRVVESCVNFVGVDLNRASAELLSYVSGINRRCAKSIVTKRKALGRFSSREQLKKVSGIGEEVFTQCAGFMRISQGKSFLDKTAIHPESYSACEVFLEKLSSSVEDIGKPDSLGNLQLKLKQVSIQKMAQEIEIGEPTLKDIIDNLMRPGRDPREGLPAPIFRKGVLSLDDLEPEMCLTGTVRNVLDFGAFIDIGLKTDGLVHVSEMANRFVRDPLDICKVGDNVEVRVLSVDKGRGRVSLSMIL